MKSRLASRHPKSVSLLVVVFLSGFTSCRLGGAEESAREPEPRVLATVNGTAITEAAFEAYVARSAADALEEATPFRGTFFREFLTNQLLLQESASLGILVEDGEILAELQQWLPEDYAPAPELIEQTRDFLKVQKLVRQVVAPQVEVTLQEMLNYYDSHQDEFAAGDRVHVLEILLADVVGLQAAEELRRELRPGDVRQFREYARRHSRGVTALAGGDLGVFEPGQLPEKFEELIFALSPGDVSRVFRSDHGYHIFMVEEWIPRHPQRFFAVQEEIFEKLVARKEREALERYMNRLLEAASIEIHDEVLLAEWRNANATPVSSKDRGR